MPGDLPNRGKPVEIGLPPRPGQRHDCDDIPHAPIPQIPQQQEPAWKTHDRNPAARPTCRTHSIWKPSGTTRAANPREDDWLHLVSAPGRLLLQATAPDGTALACGLFSPWRGRIREFDFTVFRPAFPLSVPLARAAFRWVFRHTETSALWGLCPVSNRHAWRLATACGFVITGRLPAACWLARRGVHVDGIQLLCTPETLARAIKMSPSGHRAHP